MLKFRTHQSAFRAVDYDICLKENVLKINFKKLFTCQYELGNVCSLCSFLRFIPTTEIHLNIKLVLVTPDELTDLFKTFVAKHISYLPREVFKQLVSIFKIRPTEDSEFFFFSFFIIPTSTVHLLALKIFHGWNWMRSASTIILMSSHSRQKHTDLVSDELHMAVISPRSIT